MAVLRPLSRLFRRSPAPVHALAASLTALGAISCCTSEPAKPGGSAASASGSAGAGAPSASSSAKSKLKARPIDPAVVAAAVNPTKKKPYTGPTGTVEGIVTWKGLASPLLGRGYRLAPKCNHAAGMYRDVYRAGPNNALADALVTVTGYDAFVPDKRPTVNVRVQGCAFDTRTLSMTFGQKLDVRNRDRHSTYLPHLVGSKKAALMAAIPRGEPVSIIPPRPGRYQLRDDLMHPWMFADVFVLKYPTHTVTGLSGAYKIAGVPVGKVTVHMHHPNLAGALHKEITVTAGKTTKVNFEYEVTQKKLRGTAQPPKRPTIE